MGVDVVLHNVDRIQIEFVLVFRIEAFVELILADVRLYNELLRLGLVARHQRIHRFIPHILEFFDVLFLLFLQFLHFAFVNNFKAGRYFLFLRADLQVHYSIVEAGILLNWRRGYWWRLDLLHFFLLFLNLVSLS